MEDKWNWNSYRYDTVCARATLYPGKSIEEVNKIVDNIIESCKNINYDKRT